MSPSERAAVDQAHRQFGEPTATPKPSAGEHASCELCQQDNHATLDHARDLKAERDALRKRERELVEALRGLLQVATDSYAGEPWEAIDKARVVLAKVRL